MYRNIYYDNKKSVIHHWGYDESGDPNKLEIEYKPFLYLPAAKESERDMYGIDGVPLVRKEFNNVYERNKFVESCQSIIYFNLPVPQQYLLEKYHTLDISEMTRFPLRTFFYDIEVIADEFPDPLDSKFPITSLTIYDSQTKKYYVWGIKRYDDYSCKDHLTGIEPEEIVYTYCKDEEELLKMFLRFWRRNFPDIIVGYNSYSFDLPYIVNRLELVFGEGTKNKLSPVGSVYGAEKTNRFQQKYIEYTMGGVTHLDYMVLYKYFTPGERESDSLDFVCYSELKTGKLEYGDSSLQELAANHWDRFINYNIWDVKLLMLLDEAKNYLEIAKFTAFSGFCNLDKALGKTAVITGVLAKQALDNGQIIPTQKGAESHTKIPGGYVKTPIEGLYEDIVSFDANSLYPSNIITLNISPETKTAKIIDKTDDSFTLYLYKERRKVEVPKDKLYPLIRRKNWSIAPNNVIYDQSTKGIVPTFCDILYAKRKKVKDDMLKIEMRLNDMNKDSDQYRALKATASKLDVEQYLYKILLNSTYGAFASRFFALYDLDCATSITTVGQAVIKQTEKIVNDILVKSYGLSEFDRVVSMDTDSVLISVKDVCEKKNIQIYNDEGELTDDFYALEEHVSDELNGRIKQWAIDKFNSLDPRYFFKRESVCSKAIWTGKKNYVLYIINKEGKQVNDFKYSGVQLAKSTLPNKAKDVSKKIVSIIMFQKNKKYADEMIFDAYDNQFMQFDINDIAERGNIKSLSGWDRKNEGMNTAKGTPQRAKFSIYHNELLQKLHLQNKYRRIENGSKIKTVYLKPNRFDIDGIAYQDIFPEDFELQPDYERMFFKDIIKPLQPFYDALKWQIPDPKIQYEASLEDVFG
jgi:DNA polymerase elongation subunit (family B)